MERQRVRADALSIRKFLDPNTNDETFLLELHNNDFVVELEQDKDQIYGLISLLANMKNMKHQTVEDLEQ